MSFSRIVAVLCLLSSAQVFSQGKHLVLNEEKTSLYVEDSGKGQPLVFIPGWTMTNDFFRHQKDYFKDGFRVITYDPRSHGKSSKTQTGNNYFQHAKDLKQIIDQLQLKDAILIGWSSGCATIFEYLQLYGYDMVNRVVLIDEPPKWIGNASKEWVYGTFEDYRQSLKNLLRKRLDYSIDVVNWMFKKEIKENERDWMVNLMMKTSQEAALSLYVDGMASDYSDILTEMNSKIPIQYMIRENWYEKGNQWLDKNMPNIKTVSITSHAMFLESPKEFNELLEAFLVLDN